MLSLVSIKQITILLADDHPVVRKGLRALISNESNLSVIGKSSNGHETIALVEKLQPDILILDWMMPGLNGLEVTRELTKKKSQTKIIILSLHASEVYVIDALRAGAIGYVPKDSCEDLLIQAINEASEGELYLTPPLTKRAIESYAARANYKKDEYGDEGLFESLTPREREIFQLIIEDFTNKEISVRISISQRTVHSHRANMMKKLKLRNRSELYRFAKNHDMFS